MSYSSVKNVEHKNVKTQNTQCVHSLNKMSTNNTKCLMCSFIEYNKQKIAHYAHSLSTMSNEKFFIYINFQNCDEHTSNITRRNDEKVLLLDTMKDCVIIRNTF